jgi:hypothetical protein
MEFGNFLLLHFYIHSAPTSTAGLGASLSMLSCYHVLKAQNSLKALVIL